MALIYGAESKIPANTRLTNGYHLYDWVMRKSCFPSFWGRTLTGEGALTISEIDFFKKKHCSIALIARDFTEENISSNNAVDDVLKTIEAAKRLGVPRNKSIALFAEIPETWSVNHNWMLCYAKNLLNNGYIPGFIGNTDSSKNFNFGRQCSHYVQATRGENQLHTIYWAMEPKYSFDPEVWGPYAPSELLPQDMHLWQYGTVDFHHIQVHKCYARDQSVLNAFWKV